MDPASATQSPFAALTFVAAPALLTNASSVLALSTINRMLRTRDRMQELFAQSEKGPRPAADAARFVRQVNRVEKQSALLLTALHSVYIALAAFALATLVTLLGAGWATFGDGVLPSVFAGFGVALGFVGVGGIVVGCVNLSRATQLSILNIRDEAAVIRQRQTAQPGPKL